MYTQCPDCKTAFRVAANDLRQASGKVRCGDCGAAFDALLYLFEDLPESDAGATPEPVLPELKHESKVDHPKLPESISANESIALLQTLDELAGSDIRIEDTGIEWRVLDEVAMSEMGSEEAQADDQPGPGTEVRYDDDSPLPDELVSAADQPADDEQPAENEAENVAENSNDDLEPQLMADAIDTEEIDDSGDWEAILEDIDEAPAAPIDDEDVNGEQLVQSDDGAVQAGDEDAGDADAADDAETVDEAAQGPEPKEAGKGSDPEEAGEGSDPEEAGEGSDPEEAGKGSDPEEAGEGSDPEEAAKGSDPEEAGEGSDPEEAAKGSDPEETGVTGETSDEDNSPSQWQLLDEDEQDDSIPTLTEPKDGSPTADAQARVDAEDVTVPKGDFGVESIVLEGDSVNIALEDSEAAASLLAAADAGDFSATIASPPPPTRASARRGGAVVVVLLLLAALGLQAVHQQRHTLAKIPAVNSIIGPLYRMVGKPLAPAWDVTGWSFEATSGNAADDDEQLNIYTRIGNRSDESLPYPLIGVSLTDRFEEIIGSRVIEPSGYLPSNVNPRKLTAPGDSFEAFIAVESADAMASGYKLDVCYRLPDRRLRCALGDFR